MVTGVATRKFTVEEFHRMVEAGILREDDRVELLDGEIVEMPPIGGPHSSTVDRLNRLLILALRDLPAVVRVQNPVRLPGETELYPDFAVVPPRNDYYRDTLPTSAEVQLVIEVADSSLSYDRNTKATLYARAGIAEFWLVDVSTKSVEVYCKPGSRGYSDLSYRRLGESISPVAFPSVEVSIDDFLA